MSTREASEAKNPPERAPAGPGSSVEDDLRELVPMIPRVVHGLKRERGPRLPEPPKLKEALEREGIGPRHGPVLLTLTFEGEMSVSELADRIGLRLATASLLVGELGRAGLVERREDERDRRRTLASLSEEYRRSFEPWVRAKLEPIRRTLDELSPAARAHFMEGWRLMAEEFDRPEEGDAKSC